MDWLLDPDAFAALVTLTGLEIVLGVDNIVFISILAGRLPESERARARQLGLAAAMISRLILLSSLNWIMRLTSPLFHAAGHAISGRDLILITGGLFLLWKATREIHHKVEGHEDSHSHSAKPMSFRAVIVQIMLVDMIFSLDSVITAVGMADRVSIMAAAVLISVGIMLAAAGAISAFVERHPTIKMLALSFLLLIGVTLIAEGSALHIPKGYVYFAMAFSLFVETLNIRARRPRALP